MIVDSVRIDPSKIKDAPGGGILIQGRIGRSGVQVYHSPDGKEIRVLRPRAEVEAADFEGSPLTVGHPPGGVTPSTYRQLSVGTARGRDRLDTVRGQIYPVHSLQVNDQATIERVRSGELSELSCCYHAEHDATPGVEDGESYDLVFRSLRPNHIALGPEGFARAGRAAKLLIADGESEENVLMSKSLLIADDAKSPVAPTAPNDRDALVAQVATLTAERDALKAVADSAQAELTTVTAERDALKAEASKLDEKIADGVKTVVEFRARASKVLGAEYVFDGKDEAAVKADLRAKKIEKIKEFDEGFVADGREDAYLDAYLDAVASVKPHDHNDNRPPKTGQVEDGEIDFQAHVRAVSAKAFGGAQ